ncbi:MAG: metallophosphoesterase [Oscillatoriales cyanobacterium RM1_1_9]|nr:metallophosphoesterase [Oscillatoriales cyanobacterium RM1_1_9]
MDFVSDPPIPTKIRKMKARVRWQEQSICQRGIDQTQLVIDDGYADNPAFSFLVIGDSGTGYHLDHSPQRKIAELLLEQRQNCRFLLHTGDVVYHVGSSEYYPHNFISPYREFLVDGVENYRNIAYDRMTFNFPFLPVPGNHDYYDLPKLYGLIYQLTWLPRRLLKNKVDLDVGWHGSYQGETYARAFLDCLGSLDPSTLDQHLEHHYTAKADTGNCLRYLPGLFTRLPNRYYSFRYGGIDFFALDSNTFNTPAPIPDTEVGQILRNQLHKRYAELEQQQNQLQEEATRLSWDHPLEAERLDDIGARIEHLEESRMDIEKRLQDKSEAINDLEQLEWLRQRLIQSWQNESVRGRIVYFHHPPYVTEATKWEQGQTLEVRFNLRRVLDAVSEEVREFTGDRPLIDLVLNGHAHCLEHLQTEATGHGDARIHWLVCGGGGHSLRRQRPEGNELEEILADGQTQKVTHSRLFIGRHGQGKAKHRPYSAARIDVLPGEPLQIRIQPLVAQRFQTQWQIH